MTPHGASIHPSTDRPNEHMCLLALLALLVRWVGGWRVDVSNQSIPRCCLCSSHHITSHHSPRAMLAMTPWSRTLQQAQGAGSTPWPPAPSTARRGE